MSAELVVNGLLCTAAGVGGTQSRVIFIAPIDVLSCPAARRWSTTTLTSLIASAGPRCDRKRPAGSPGSAAAQRQPCLRQPCVLGNTPCVPTYATATSALTFLPASVLCIRPLPTMPWLDLTYRAHSEPARLSRLCRLPTTPFLQFRFAGMMQYDGELLLPKHFLVRPWAPGLQLVVS